MDKKKRIFFFLMKVVEIIDRILIFEMHCISIRNSNNFKCKQFTKLMVPGGSDGKASSCEAGEPGSIPGLGRSPGEENGNPFQYSCLENSMDRGAWQAMCLLAY